MQMDLYAIVLALILNAAPAAVAAAQVFAGASGPMRAGDRVLVRISLDTLVVDSARVLGDGRVVLPRLGAVGIAGLPAATIPDSIRSAYARVLSTVAVEVTPLRRVTVLGEVRRPAIYFVEPDAAIRDVVAAAGGITDIGATGKVTLVRDSSTRRVGGWERTAASRLPVASGDVIWVSREPWWKRNALGILSTAAFLYSVVYTVTRR